MPSTWSQSELQDLVSTWQPVVYRLALSYTRTIPDAEDITQEVFLRALRAHPVFSNDEHTKAWFLRVTINCCKTHLGSYWRRNVEQLPDDALSDTSSPVTSQERHEQQESVLKAVSRLPWKQRVCVHLFYYEDAPIDTIAQVLSMKPSTIRSHLHRARLALKATLKEAYDEL